MRLLPAMMICAVAVFTSAQPIQAQDTTIFTSAQSGPTQNASVMPTDKQRLALDLFERARVLSAQTSPEAQAYLCQEATQAQASLPGISLTAQLRECFQKTFLLEPASPLRRSLQSQIVTQLGVAAPDQLSDLLAGAEPQVQTALLEKLIEKQVGQKHWDKALSLLALAPRDEYFPYSAAAQLMIALPEERRSDQRTIFALALQSYRNSDEAGIPGLEDLGTIVVRFWAQLPPDLVLQSADELLKKAKEKDVSKAPVALTVGTKKGEAQFDTIYSYRLFELLPIVRQLDSARAKSLLSDSPQLKQILDSYPKGLASLEPALTDSVAQNNGRPPYTLTYSLKGGASPVSLEAPTVSNRIARNVAELVTQVVQDPTKLAATTALPMRYPEGLKSPKLDALGSIALALARQSPSTSRDALRSARSAVIDLPPISQCHYLTGIANTYLRLNDFDDASSVLDQAAKQAKLVYATDTSDSDPNRAFKLYWPSAVIYRAITVLRGRVSPQIAANLAEQFPDPELSSSALSALASDLLGVSPMGGTMETQFNNDAMHGSFPLTR